MNENNQLITDNNPKAMTGFVTQFFVFSGETYLGWDCFDSPSVKVGSSAFADLVLDDPDLEDIQAEFVIENGRIRVVNLGTKDVIIVNNRSVANCIIGSFDVLKIGKYTIKAKLKKISGMTVDDSPVIREDVVQNIRKSIDLEIDCQDIAPTLNNSNNPPIVQELLTIMDENDNLDFESIEEILTSKSKGDSLPAAPQQKAPSIVCSDEVTDKFKIKDLSSVTKKKAEKTEITNRPTPFSIVAEKRQSSSENFLTRIKDEKQVQTEDNRSVEQINQELGDTKITKEALPLSPPVQHEKSVSKQQGNEPSVLTATQALVDESNKPEPSMIKHAKSNEKNKLSQIDGFPPHFFTAIDDDEDDEDDDCPANFSLRDIITGDYTEKVQEDEGEKVLEIIRFKGDRVLSVIHLKDQDEHELIRGDESFCHVCHSEGEGTRLYFSKPLLGIINRVGGQKLKAEASSDYKKFGVTTPAFASLLPVQGELTVSDGFYDFVIRKSIISNEPILPDDTVPALPVHKRVIHSKVFKYMSWAVAFHLMLMVVLNYSITWKKISTDFKVRETVFAKVETQDIHKPTKPIPKPKPVKPEPLPIDNNAFKRELVKQDERESINVASRSNTNSRVAPNRSGSVDTGEGSVNSSPDAGGGHGGNVLNRNINQVGLLATLGKKTGISLSPNEALASAVTNMDAVSSSRSNEGFKVGGIKANLGDSKIAFSSGKGGGGFGGGIINNKGGAGVYRSAGIGGKGSVAAMESGKTGKRSVKAVVAAPVAKKVRASGGGISREAVAKVINDHMDEINACYESALINDSNLLGRIEFEWTILQSGDVGDVKIKSSTVKSSQLHSCIISAIKGWKFPKPNGADVIVSYPFVFDITGF